MATAPPAAAANKDRREFEMTDVELGGPAAADVESAYAGEEYKEAGLATSVIPITAVVVEGAPVVLPDEDDHHDEEDGTHNARRGGDALPTATEQQMAVPLTPRAAAAAEGLPTAAVTLQGTVVEKIKERPRATCAGCGCCVAMLVFLLAFLLIPRNPSVRLQDVSLSSISRSVGDDDAPPQDQDVISVKLKFNSQSLTDNDWRDLDVDLEWLVDNGSVDVARVERKSSFRTGAYGQKTVRETTNDIENLGTVASLRSVCATDRAATLRVRGHVRSEGTRFRVQSDWRNVDCDVLTS